MNPLHAAGQVWGAILIIALLVALVCIQAWPILAMIAIGVPIVGWLERTLRPDLYPPTEGEG